MPIPRQKFCTGEMVSTAFNGSPNLDAVEIIECRWLSNIQCVDRSGYVGRVSSWVYFLDNGNSNWALEKDLRKLPPDPESWDRCEFNPNKDDILIVTGDGEYESADQYEFKPWKQEWYI